MSEENNDKMLCNNNHSNNPPQTTISQSETKTRRTLNGQAREIVFNVYNYFSGTVKKGDRTVNLCKKTSEATGISLSTVQRIVAEVKKQIKSKKNQNNQEPNVTANLPVIGKHGEHDYAASSHLGTGQEAKTKMIDVPKGIVFDLPSRKRPLGTKCIKEFDIILIRQCINELYLKRKELPNMQTVYESVKTLIDFKESSSTLSRALGKLGYQWKKLEYNKSFLLENNKIRSQRKTFLSQLMKYKSQHRTIVYTDEMHIDVAMNIFDEPLKESKLNSTEERVNIIHACNENGFLTNASKLLITKPKVGDPRRNIDADVYMQWVRVQLLPNLQPNSVLIINNAPHHNVEDTVPSKDAEITEMLSWLQKNNIFITRPQNATKLKLLKIIEENRNKGFVLDKLLEEHGHTVLRIPDYHSELNPLRWLWWRLRSIIAARDNKYDISLLYSVCEKELASLEINDLKNAFESARDCEEIYNSQDNMLDDFFKKEFDLFAAKRKSFEERNNNPDVIQVNNCKKKANEISNKI